MSNEKLTLSSIIGVGVLASSLVIGTEMTHATMLESDTNSEYSHEKILEDYPEHLKNTPSFSFQYDQIKIGMDNIEEDYYPEAEVIEVPVVKKMVFQFKKPVKLEFS